MNNTNNPGPSSSQAQQQYAISAQQQPSTSGANLPEQQKLNYGNRANMHAAHQHPQGSQAAPASRAHAAPVYPPQHTVPKPEPSSGGPPFPGPTAYRGSHQAYFASQQQQQQTAQQFASPSRKSADRSRGSAAGQKKQCNCKNSRCLKLYCECFASGRYCDACNCVNCFNNRENEAVRQSAVENILERNPNAFRPKIQNSELEGAAQQSRGVSADSAPPPRHMKGCNCKKSTCLKKYCECFQAAIFCSDNCKCIDCKNFEGSEARSMVLVAQDSAASSAMMSPVKRSRLSSQGPPQAVGPSRASASHRAPPQQQPHLSAVQVVSQPIGHPQLQPHHPAAPRPARPPAPPPAPTSQSRPIQEMVNMLVKGDTIGEVCRLLLLVADDEGSKVNATAAEEARSIAPHAAAAASAAASAAAAAMASGEGAGQGDAAPSGNGADAVLQNDCSTQLSARRIETRERVVMVEFLSVLESFIAAGQRKGGPADGPSPQTMMPPPGPLVRSASGPPPSRQLSMSAPPFAPAPFQGAPSSLPSASLPTVTTSGSILSAAHHMAPPSLLPPSIPPTAEQQLLHQLDPSLAPASMPHDRSSLGLPTIDLPLKQLDMPEFSLAAVQPSPTPPPPELQLLEGMDQQLHSLASMPVDMDNSAQVMQQLQQHHHHQQQQQHQQQHHHHHHHHHQPHHHQQQRQHSAGGGPIGAEAGNAPGGPEGQLGGQVVKLEQMPQDMPF